jgi:hypothetical protein
MYDDHSFDPDEGFGYYPGEDRDPRKVALESRGDYIGPEELEYLLSQGGDEPSLS